MAEPVPFVAVGTKISTGIPGFDLMADGGLPAGRVSAVLGGAGTGKTVFAMQTLVHRIRESGGIGIFVSFEQSPESIAADLASFDWQAPGLVESGRLILIDGRPQADILLSGAFDIAGLLATVEGATDDAAAACVVFDGIDTLLTILASPAAQRGELLRLQDHVLRLRSTVILTLKANPVTGGGFEELALYMADCVVELARDIDEGISSRRIRIQKYRSSGHAQSRLPFVMTSRGIEVEAMDTRPRVIPVSNERLSTGIGRLDDMLAGGFFRGSITLLSGAPGTAKTTLATRFVETVCRRGERALGICFDEAPEEIIRNVASVGTDLTSHIESGLLRMHGMVDRTAGPDEFVHEIGTQIRVHRPRHLMIDPISVFTTSATSQNAVHRLIQLCKQEGITVMLTSLLDRSAIESESSRSYVSTLCDNWIHLSYMVHGGERNRALTVIKSRGTAHSNQVGELLLGDGGITIADVYTEEGVVLMGSLRWQKERASQQAVREEELAAAHRYRDAERSVDDISRRIVDLNAELAGRLQEMEALRSRTVEIERLEEDRRMQMSRLRGAAEMPAAAAGNGAS